MPKQQLLENQPLEKVETKWAGMRVSRSCAKTTRSESPAQDDSDDIADELEELRESGYAGSFPAIDLKFLCTTANQMRGVDFILEKNKLMADPLIMPIVEEAAKKIQTPAADWSRMFNP